MVMVPPNLPSAIPEYRPRKKRVGILRKIAYTRIKENSWKTERKPRLEINSGYL
jgi:hypothetical protein